MAIIMGFKEKTNLITKFFNLPFHSAVLQNILLSRLWLEDNIESEGFESSFGLINLEIWNFISGSKLPFPTHIWPSPGNWMMPSSLLRCSLLLMVALIPLPTMLQSDIAQIFPGSSTRSKRQESGINTADFLLDFLEELPQDAATLITHPDSGDVNFSLVF